MADVQRCVILARIIGVMERAAPKVKMFMISVQWSDQREVTVYRLFQDFEKFHRQLKRLAVTNPARNAGGLKRMIPKFKTRAMRSSMPRKGSTRAVSRMRFLSSYCNELLRCDATVTQSSELTQFFMPRKHDLEPDFTKNSIMVLLSEDRSEVTDSAAGVQHRGSVTYPFVTQTYRCVDDYETMDTLNLPFKVTMNQKVDVLIKDPTGWWLVEHEDKSLAWFPAPYLAKCEDEDDAEDEVLNGDRWIRKDSQDGQIKKTAMYCAIRNYSSEEQDEVSLNIGSVVELLKKSDNGWWLVRYKDKDGYVPALCLEQYHQQRSRLYSLIGKLPNSSTLNMAANGLMNASRRGSFFSLPEANSPNVSVQRVASPGRLQSSVSTAESEFSSVSFADSYKSPISTLSRLSSYSSMSSVESGLSAYKPRLFQWQGMKDHPDHASLPETRTSDGGHASPDLRLAQGQHQDHPPGHTSSSQSMTSEGKRGSPDVSPTRHLRLAQGKHQDHPGHTSSSQPRMSDGERSSPDDSPAYDLKLSLGQHKDHPEHTSSSQPRMSDGECSNPDLNSTDLPHPGTGSDSPGSDRSKGQHKDHPGHTSSSQSRMSDGERSSPDVSPTYHLRLSKGQHQDHPGHISAFQTRTSNDGHASPDLSPTNHLRLSQGQHKDHLDHTSTSQFRMSDWERSSPDVSPTYHLRLSKGQHQDHPGHISSSRTWTSNGGHASAYLSPTNHLTLSQGQRKDHLGHTSTSQSRMSNWERSRPDVSPTYDLRLSQGQHKDHPGHASSSQSRMSDGPYLDGPYLGSTDLPHPGTGSDSPGSDRSKGQHKNHPGHTSSSQSRMSDGECSSPDVSSAYDLKLLQGQHKDHPGHTSSSQSRMSDGERSNPDLSSTDLPHPGPGSDSPGSDRSKGSKTELVTRQVHPMVVFIVESSVQILKRQMSAP